MKTFVPAKFLHKMVLFTELQFEWLWFVFAVAIDILDDVILSKVV